MACSLFCPLLYVKKILCVFEINRAQGPPQVKFWAHICMGRGRYSHARSSMPVNCPIKGFLFLKSYTRSPNFDTFVGVWDFCTTKLRL